MTQLKLSGFFSVRIGPLFQAILIPLFIYFYLVSLPNVYAQDSSADRSSIPSSEQATVLGKKAEEEQEEELERRRQAPEITVQAKEPEPETREDIHFFVREIHVKGSIIIPKTTLDSMTAAYENKELTLSEINQLTKAITEKYHQKGFQTSFAYLPPQQVRDGKLSIVVVEGKVGDIWTEGNRFFRKRKIISYLPLRQGEILNVKKIQLALKRLNDNLKREVSALITAGKKPGTTDIILKVKDRFPAHADFSFDNQGIDSSGELRYGFTVTDYNFSSLDDVASVGTIFGKHFGFIFTQYQIPLPLSDTNLVMGFNHGQSNPVKDLKPLGVNSRSETYTSGIEHTFFRGDHITMDLSGGFEIREGRTLLEARTYTRERLRILRFAPKIVAFSSQSATAFTNEFRFGIDSLGAAIHADSAVSRQGVEPSFFIFKGKLHHFQKMPLDTKAMVQIEFQHPSRKLPSQEALYLGGGSTVRGYPEGDYLADSGFRVTVEYLLPFLFFPKDLQLPRSTTPLRKQVEMVAFVDEAYGRLRGPSDSEAGLRHLTGVGGGLRIRLYQHLFARIEWGIAVGDHPLRAGNRHEFNFRLQAET